MIRKEKNWLELLQEKKKQEIEKETEERKKRMETPSKLSIGKKVYSEKKKTLDSRKKKENNLKKNMKIDKEKMTPKKKTTTLEVMMKRNRKETMKTENETEIKEIIKKFEGIGAQMKTGKKITLKEKDEITCMKPKIVLDDKDCNSVEYGSRTRKNNKGALKNDPETEKEN